tara:strand:+ start:2145 stop:2321 length:177 start_codon:yes stop_codon:yes gene_type:complete
MGIKKSIIYKTLIKKHIDYKLEFRIKAHERDLDILKHKIEAHNKILEILYKRKANEKP